MKKESRVCGNFPERLIRYFDREEFAVEFCDQGRFRLGANTYYKSIECVNRRDAEEGKGKYRYHGKRQVGLVSRRPNIPTEWIKEEGEIEVTVEHGSPVYLLCCTVSDDLTYITKEFGEYPVEIQKPRLLAEMMDGYFQSISERFLIYGQMVQYNRAELFPKEIDRMKACDLAFTQKSSLSKENKEFRYCAISTGPDKLWINNPPEYLYINLNIKQDYVKPLW